MDDKSLFHDIPLFSSLTDAELHDVIVLMEHHSFASGAVIMKEGDPGASFHLVIAGDARIVTSDRNGREVLLDEIGMGGFVGELSLLTGEPRSASAIATSEVMTLALDRDAFLLFLRQHPHACFTILTVLGQRLSRSAELLRTSVRNVNEIELEQLTLGQRISDALTARMGSWAFIGIQSLILVIYFGWNVASPSARWDPYPFMLMSLILSFQAAYAAPIIMMSQNRQSAKDRLTVENSYEVNLKTSAQMALLHQRLDDLEGMFAAKEQHSVAVARSTGISLADPQHCPT